MCGIAGFFDLRSRPSRKNAGDLLLGQICACQYRGPDAKGVWHAPGVGLAHARLAIIDLSEAANQPMFSQDGQIAIAFNGEIYNFQEIRARLEARGHEFRTQSDTEVIIEGYRAWGTDVVHHLRGMFAIALLDRAKDELILIRDRVGKKPLCYGVFNDTLVFGSEVKSILRWPGVPRAPNFGAIHQYLTFQYVPAPLTAFEGIFKLPPAHMLVVKRGAEPRLSRYFELPKPAATRRRPEGELLEELVHHLREATRLRLISDVPLGAFLSGGVDSSSVVAMMALESGQPAKTFTIGFEEQVYDERPFARAVAERYATDHHEFILRPDALSILDELVYHYNEPFADSSAIPTYYVSKIAREHVTVALNGDGADESFVGYTRYLNCRRLDRIDVLPPWLLAPLARTMRALPSIVEAVPLVGRARRALTLLQDSPSRRYEPFIAYFTEDGKETLYGAGMAAYKNRPALARLDGYFAESTSMAMGAAWADIHTYLPDDLLVKVDIASMANSLEARSPFLDHELMSWAATIPENQRFTGGEPKALLKKAMEPFLPRDLLYRPKMGFGVPVELWLRGELKEIVRETLLGRTAIERGLFRREAIEDMLTRHWSGENFAPQLWALLMLELWFQMWIDPAEPFAGSVPERLGGHTAAVAA